MSKANIFLIVLLIGIPIAFGVVKMPMEMGLATAALSLAFLLANAEKFSRFEVGNIKAELRETVGKAQASIEQLKQIGLAIARPISNSAISMCVPTLAVGPMDVTGEDFKDACAHIEQLEQNLRALGANDHEIRSSLDGFLRASIGAYEETLGRMENDSAKQALQGEYRRFREKWKVSDAFLSANSAQTDSHG